jgi:hypothetical protein
MEKKKQDLSRDCRSNGKPMGGIMSAFYCKKKGCRKSAWETPEHLTSEDRGLVSGAVKSIKAGLDPFAAFLEDLPKEKYDAFFDRVIGWPEGKTYWRNVSPTGKGFYYTAIVKHNLPKLLEAQP